MCGIAGIVGIDKSVGNLTNMLNAMHHRGPDDWGVFEDDYVVLGHKRLAIIDLSPAGHQPMLNQAGNLAIVFNGEIYNYQELKKLLPASTQLKSSTDTEIVLELWNILGIELLPKLRGMFALAIWDKQKQELVIARDHMGIKPLYYQHKNNVFTFASELKGILAGGLVEKRINPIALKQYLSNGYILQPLTILQEVHMLPPATYLILKDNEKQIHTYWDITQKPKKLPQTEQQAINEVKNLLVDAVKEEAIADRPLGIFLSGGLDSTVLVAALKESGSRNIKTFSVGFDGDELSEEDDAKEAASFYHTSHTQLQVTDADIVPHINEYIKAIDQPSIDGLNTWLVSKVTAKHVTVALSGLGGDELFSGYSIDRKILRASRYKWIGQLVYTISLLHQLTPKKLRNKLQTLATWRSLPAFYQSWGSLFSPNEINTLLEDNQNIENGFNTFNLSKQFSLLQRVSFMHLRSFMMSRLLRDSDAVSMDHSIEVRFPVIDYRLVQLAFHLPDEWKVKFLKETARLKNYEKENSYEYNGVKHLLYQAFKNNLPPNFGLRPKRGFKMPIEKWMQKGLLDDIQQTLMDSNTILNQSAVRTIFSNWISGNEPWTKVWAIYVFEKWAATNIK